MNIQFIGNESNPEYAVVPIAAYRELLEKAEMLEDVEAYDKAKAAQKAGESEFIPDDVVGALLEGENPVRVWRKFRGMSQAELAKVIDTSQAYVAQIESGKREGTVKVYRSIAEALRVDIDDLVESQTRA